MLSSIRRGGSLTSRRSRHKRKIRMRCRRRLTGACSSPRRGLIQRNSRKRNRVELAGRCRHAHGMDRNLAGNDAAVARGSGSVAWQASFLLPDRRVDKAGAHEGCGRFNRKESAAIYRYGFALRFVLGIIHLARLNYRQGRCDREGAFRLASVMFVLEMLLWLCRGHC